MTGYDKTEQEPMESEFYELKLDSDNWMTVIHSIQKQITTKEAEIRKLKNIRIAIMDAGGWGEEDVSEYQK